MKTPLEQVAEFHEAFGLPIRNDPTWVGTKEANFRITLIQEECAEAVEAMADEEDILHVAKELADIVYVVYGAALHYGIDLDAVLEEVHRSNMTKLWPCDACNGRGVVDDNGGPDVWGRNDCCICDGRGEYVKYRDDGKVLKPPSYTKADLSKVIEVAES